MRPAFVAVLLLAACSMFAGEIATDPQFVPTGTPMVDTGVAIVDASGFDTGRNYVVVPDTTVLPAEAPVIDPEKVSEGDLNAVAAVGGAVAPFLPAPLQPLVPLVMYVGARLFGKRYRQNWGASIKSLASGDVKGAVRMAAAAEGIVHTTEDPQALRAVADRKAALAVVEDKHPAPVPAPPQ